MNDQVWGDQVGIVPFIQLLSTNGDGTGTTNIVGTYASVAETFELHGPTAADTHTVIERIMVYIQDTGTFAMESYGAVTPAAALSTGIKLDVTDSSGTSIINLTPEPVTINGEWGAYCYDIRVDDFGVGDQAMQARWTFTKFTADAGLWLNDGQKLVLTANDDLDDLVAQRVTCQGYRVGPGIFY